MHLSTYYLFSFIHWYLHKKQSPDVETPGLLVKALISSYFMMVGSIATLSIYFSATNIIE
jgi:hypothetical protein